MILSGHIAFHPHISMNFHPYMIPLAGRDNQQIPDLLYLPQLQLIYNYLHKFQLGIKTARSR